MDHTEIEEAAWSERYLAGTLSPEEAEAFEQHYLSCPRCIERLELDETLRDGLRVWSAEQAVRQNVARAGLLAWMARRGRSRQLALALTAVLLLAVLPSGLLLRQVGELRGELSRARAAATAAGASTGAAAGARTGADTRTGAGTGAAAGAPAPRPAPAADGGAARRIAQLADELAAERLAAARAAAGERRARGDRDGLAHELELERQPRINTPIVTLSPLRSAGEAAPPAVRIALPPPAAAGAPRPGAWIALALELDGPRYPAYAATLAKAGGATIWRGAGLRPDASESLTLSLPAALLAPGDYEILVDGLPAGAPPQPVARFSFRALGGG